ncbi:uncharacterized protein KZ484_012522 [Pholidichthys leucotaenia]
MLLPLILLLNLLPPLAPHVSASLSSTFSRLPPFFSLSSFSFAFSSASCSARRQCANASWHILQLRVTVQPGCDRTATSLGIAAHGLCTVAGFLQDLHNVEPEDSVDHLSQTDENQFMTPTITEDSRERSLVLHFILFRRFHTNQERPGLTITTTTVRSSPCFNCYNNI